jgi:catechol 2,3-dioxygenase
MIHARQLGHVVLKVRNAARSRDFYRRTLGLKVSLEDAALGAVFLSVGETHHDLALFEVATGAGADATQPGLHHMAWRLGSFEELQAAYEELKVLGVPIESTIDHNVTRSIYFQDPDGNRVELYCDMVVNGFEAMRTLRPANDRLDLDPGERPEARSVEEGEAA